MTARDPCGVDNFEVELGGENIGFSEVRGLGCELDHTGTHVDCRANAVTLRRAFSSDLTLWSWVNGHRSKATDTRTVRITLMDSLHRPICTWVLQRARPIAWTGPQLDSMATGQLAMEELVIAAESIDCEPSQLL